MAECPVRSEIAGIVARIVSAVGTRVAEGDEVLLLESMKMELPVLAPAAGLVANILVAEGDSVAEGQIVAMLAR